MSPHAGLRRSALKALSWSVVQNWVGRGMATLVFLLLARLLSPDDFGIASSAFLIMTFLSLIAELGFGDAIVQRSTLTPEQLNLPFWASMGATVLLSLCAAALAWPITQMLGLSQLAPYIIGASALCPLMILAGFLEAMYRRSLRFRALALRTFIGLAAGGIVGVGCALAGFGPWSIIAQFGTQTVVSVLCLWSHSVWKPGLTFDRESFRELTTFGSSMVGMRIVDFITLRSVDLIILMKFGTTALGLFAVSSRLFQLLMQLFQASISNVGLSVLSKVADNKPLIARLFERSSSISAMAGTPVFIGLAALAPEVSLVMFGSHWTGAAPVMRPLLLIGGISCIQFTMGTYLAALGQPRTLLRLMLLKAAIVLPAILLVPATSVAEIATVFALALLAETPFILRAAVRAIDMDWRRLLRPVGLPMVANIVAFVAIEALRTMMPLPDSPFVRMVVMGCLFALIYALAAFAFATKAIIDNFQFARKMVN